MSDTAITKSVFFTAPRETVWAFLTEKDKLAQWFHPAEANLEAGKDYALVETGDDGVANKVCWGSVLEMDKPSRLVCSFTIKPLAGKMTTVTWTLEEAHGGTRLSLLHEGVSKAAGEMALGLLMALDAGWDKHLASLRGQLAAD